MAIESPTNRLFQTAGQNKAQTGTGYTNLNRFFSANKDNQLGQKVSGNLQNQVGSVKGQLGEQKSAFEQQAEQNRLDTEQNKQSRDAVIGRFSDTSNAGGEIAQDDVKKFEQFRAGQYAGPSGLQDTQALASQAGELRQQTSNLSPSGTQELLRRSVGQGGRYTQGQQRLDSLLMDRTGLKQVGREAAGLTGEINRANAAASGKAQQYSGLAKQFGEETTGQLTNALGGLDTAAEAQLKSAQDAENARQTQLQTLLNTLQGDMIPKLDAQGNQVLDDNGQPVMEKKLTGTTDPYARIDEVAGLLKNQGLANQNQLEALFGKGSFSENKSNYDKNLAEVRKNEIFGYITGTSADPNQNEAFGSQLFKAAQSQKNPYYSGYGVKGYTPDIQAAGQSVMNKVKNFIGANKLDPEDSGAWNTAFGELFKSGQISEDEIQKASKASVTTFNTNQKAGQSADLDQGLFWRQGYNTPGGDALATGRSYNTYVNPIEQQRAAELEKFKGSTGIAGRSTLDSRQDDFYKTLAGSLQANTKQAENLTKSGVASDAIRGNYGALSQLLGKGADTSPFRANDARYKAGQIGLDAAQIRRALGY